MLMFDFSGHSSVMIYNALYNSWDLLHHVSEVTYFCCFYMLTVSAFSSLNVGRFIDLQKLLSASIPIHNKGRLLRTFDLLY